MNKNEEIDKLKIALMRKIKLENDPDYVDLSADEIMKIIIDASNKGKYVFWVLREYLKGNVQRFEDMGRIKQALILFKNNLSKFTEQEKQLNKLSFQGLEELVSPFQDILTQNEIKRMNKEKIWSEIETIYSGPEGKIYIPKTKKASIFLGQGTKWCTAAAKNNLFEHYNKKSPLYVLVTNKKDNEGREIKYQLHVETGQFMDFEDKKVSLHENGGIFLMFFKILSLKDKITFASKNLSHIDSMDLPHQLSNEIKLKSVKEDGFSIRDIVNPTEDIKLQAVKQNGYAIQHIDNSTEQIKLEAVRQNGSTIQYIINPTEEMRLDAVKQNGMAIQYIINPTEEIKLEAVKQNGCAIQYIDNPTEEMKLAACKSNGNAIQYIQNPTEKMKIDACKSKSYAIQYIHNPTEEMKLAACKSNGHTIKYIDNPTDEMKLEAVKENAHTIQHIKNPSNEIKLQACKSNGEAIYLILDPTDEMKSEAIKQNGFVVRFIKNLTDEMKLEACKSNGSAIAYIKNPTDEMKLEAVKQNGLSLCYIRRPTKKIKIEAVKQNGLSIFYISNPTEEIKILAVEQNVMAVEYIKNPTDEMMKKFFDILLEKNEILKILDKVVPKNIEQAEYYLHKSQNNATLKYYFEEIIDKFTNKTDFKI